MVGNWGKNRRPGGRSEEVRVALHRHEPGGTPVGGGSGQGSAGLEPRVVRSRGGFQPGL